MDVAGMLARMHLDISKDAAIRAIHEEAMAIAAYAMPPPRPAFRHRRGRGVSKGAKRRHARRVREHFARPALHHAAARAWVDVSVGAAEIVEKIFGQEVAA